MGNGICVPFRPMPDQKPVRTRWLGGFSVLFHFRTSASLPCLAIFSIKHDLARSCFQLWPKIGDEGDKNGKMKNFSDTLPLTSLNIILHSKLGHSLLWTCT